MKLHAFNCGVELVDIANFDPMGAEVGTKVLTPYFLYLVEHEQGPVLFDTGASPDFIGTFDPEHPDPAHAGPKIASRPEHHPAALLGTVGLTPADIEHVALSHLHVDHAGGVPLFAHAQLHIQARELAFALDPPVYQRDVYRRQDFDDPALRWHELDGEHDLFGDGRLVLIPTPGHSAGHQSLLVRLDSGQTVILVADAAYSPRNLDERRLPAILWSPDAMVASWERLDALRAEHDAHLIFTHDLAWPTSVRLAPDAHYA